MTEHPILFSAPMIRAILDGRKTMTRRIVKPQPKIIHAIHSDASLTTERIFRSGDQRIHCPYGQPGDRLWVRETWGFTAKVSTDGHERWLNEHDTTYLIYRATCGDERAALWRPSIFMPRWASRITLEITGIRVERLQEITCEDAKAEGAGYYVGGEGIVSESALRIEPGYWHGIGGYRSGFEMLWQEINAKRAPWASNPWVWVISFKKIA